MAETRNDLSAAYVRSLLDYDPTTGVWTWRVGRHAGRRAGFIGTRCRRIGIDGTYYQLNRLAWLWMTGSWPEHLVDYKNRDVLDGRWENLRPATRGQDKCNEK